MKWSARGWDEESGAAHSLGQNWNVAARGLQLSFLAQASDQERKWKLGSLSHLVDDHEVRWWSVCGAG